MTDSKSTLGKPNCSSMTTDCLLPAECADTMLHFYAEVSLGLRVKAWCQHIQQAFCEKSVLKLTFNELKVHCNMLAISHRKIS